jgi:hypothetical protein
LIAGEVFRSCGLGFAALGTGFRGILEGHRNLSFRCQAGGVYKTSPGVFIGFELPQLYHELGHFA